MGRKKSYEAKEITVHYESALCIHAAECVNGLPKVFDPKRRPWIDVEAADADALAGVVERCPTGALSYTRIDLSAERPDAEPSIRLARNGPLFLRGDVTIIAADGVETKASRSALCRCGHSENKPFCDNSHVESSFRG